MSSSSPVPSWDEPLARALRRAVDELPAGVPRTVLFSGGVDSGLLGWELRSDPGVTLFTVGLNGSADLLAAEPASRELSLPWAGEPVSEAQVLAVAGRIQAETRNLSPTARSVEVAFTLAVEHAPAGVVVCGQGADELFLGYAHFRGLDEERTLRRAEADLRYLRTEAWPRSRRIAAAMGREVVAPYLDPGFVSVAEGIPMVERMAGPDAKHAFRLFARRRGLPEAIAYRPKKALQYGTGVDRLLRRAGV